MTKSVVDKGRTNWYTITVMAEEEKQRHTNGQRTKNDETQTFCSEEEDKIRKYTLRHEQRTKKHKHKL